jgi:hypothetical protein
MWRHARRAVASGFLVCCGDAVNIYSGLFRRARRCGRGSSRFLLRQIVAEERLEFCAIRCVEEAIESALRRKRSEIDHLNDYVVRKGEGSELLRP